MLNEMSNPETGIGGENILRRYFLGNIIHDSGSRGCRYYWLDDLGNHPLDLLRTLGALFCKLRKSIKKKSRLNRTGIYVCSQIFRKYLK